MGPRSFDQEKWTDYLYFLTCGLYMLAQNIAAVLGRLQSATLTIFFPHGSYS